MTTKICLWVVWAFVFILPVQAGFTGSASPTWRIGSFGWRNFYRTNFVTEAGNTGSANHPPFGLYDPTSNQTFLVYSNGLRSNNLHSAQDPYITSFNHTTSSWANPVRVVLTEPLGATADDHNFPQIVIDNQGKLHLFHTFHNTGIDILHATSKLTRNIGSSADDWNVSSIPKTCHNTYGGAFIDNQGEMYVFFRSSEGATRPIPDPAVYEPEAMVKSTDSGATWLPRRIVIDPGRHPACNECAKNPDGSYIDNHCPGWNNQCCSTGIVHNLGPNEPGPTTIYVGDMLQDKNRNGLWMTFSPFVGHGGYPLPPEQTWPTPKYLVFFSFDNDHFYSHNGDDLGPVLEHHEYMNDNCCTVDPTANGQHKHTLVMENHPDRVPTVYYTISDPSGPVDGFPRQSFQARWDSENRKWDKIELTSVFGDIVSIAAGGYSPDNGTDLFIRSRTGGQSPFDQCSPAISPSLNYHWPIFIYNNKNGWKSIRLFNPGETDLSGNQADNTSREVRGASRISLIPNPHPAIRAFVSVPQYTCAKPTLNDGGFWKTWPIVDNFVVGDSPLRSSSIRPALCQSTGVSSALLTPTTPLTITSTANTTNIKRFVYAFYNRDNEFSPENPKPIQFQAGINFSKRIDNYSPANTQNVIISHAELNQPDLNWEGKIPRNIQVNAYFINSLDQLSAADPRCVSFFRTALQGDLNSDNRVDIVYLNSAISSRNIFTYNLVVANYGN